MANFNAYLPQLLRFEGGFVNDPADPGGATNKGVTFQTFRSCCDMLGVAPTLANLKALTDEQAGRIYKRLYWDWFNADALQCQPLAEMLVDFYVNAGGNAVKVLQKALNDDGLQPPLIVDGAMGPATSRALADADATRGPELYRHIKAGRIDYYLGLAALRPPLQRFLKGWFNRVNAFPDQA